MASKKYYIVLGILLMLVLGIFIWLNFAMAKEILVVNEVSPTSSPVSFNMLEKIREGRDLLKNSQPLEYESKVMRKKNGKLVKTGELVRMQIALAILNKNTGEIFQKRMWVKQQDIKNYKKTGVLEFQPATANDNLIIRPEWWNSFNTFYEVVGHPEMAVVADKYPFPSKYLVGLAERSAGEYTEIIYAPYSKQIHVQAILDAGKNYLEKNIDQAFNELDAGRVFSRTSPGTLVTQGVTKDFVRNIILVEHVDPDSFAVSADDGRELSERVLVIIGANQGYAYRYTGSPAGASGLAQFISSTYKSIVKRYPEANLIKDYNAGMANHVNAIKAMVLFFDSHGNELSDRISRRDIVRSLGITEEMLAATYNGGPAKVIKSVNKYGLAWFSNQLGISSSGKILRQETISYVKKFRAIKNLNLFAGISVN